MIKIEKNIVVSEQNELYCNSCQYLFNKTCYFYTVSNNETTNIYDYGCFIGQIIFTLPKKLQEKINKEETKRRKKIDFKFNPEKDFRTIYKLSFRE